MRNTAIVLGIAAAFAVAPVFAQDNAPTGADSGFFVSGNAGHSYFGSGQNSGSDTGYVINGGYRWALSPSFALGPEIGYNDLGNVRVHNVFNTQPVIANDKAALHGWTLGASAKYNLTPNWYLAAHAGLYQWTGRGTTNDITPLNIHRDANSYYGGVGVGYDISRNFGVGVGYDYFRAQKRGLNLSTGLLSANAEVRF